MAITLDGTTGVTAAEFDGALDASSLTGTLPAIDGSALTGIDTAPPTSYGAVGTYAWGRPLNATAYVAGDTASGFNPVAMASYNYYASYYSSSGAFGNYNSSNTLSGTWRAMGTTTSIGELASTTLWVRIS
ncbi:MAG: hypothetical protein ACSHXL_00025 [Bacteroidota bacterium]